MLRIRPAQVLITLFPFVFTERENETGRNNAVALYADFADGRQRELVVDVSFYFFFPVRLSLSESQILSYVRQGGINLWEEKRGWQKCVHEKELQDGEEREEAKATRPAHSVNSFPELKELLIFFDIEKQLSRRKKERRSCSPKPPRRTRMDQSKTPK